MADARKFSRARREIKLTQREAVERDLNAMMYAALRERDPTVPTGAVKVISELVAVVASQLLAQTQVTHRALLTMKDDVSDYGTEFVAQLVIEARKDVGARVKRTTVAAPSVSGSMPLADDWAGPVAGPTLIERHFGIPRSTLHRWRQRNEVVALNTRTSKKPVFPLRQFVDGRPAGGIPEIIRAFGDHRSAWQWMITANPRLDDAAPIEALLKGHVEHVVEVARNTA